MRKLPTVTDVVNALPAPPETLGMDLGDRRSHVCVLAGGQGGVLERFTVDTTVEAVRVQLARWKGRRIVIEAGTHSPWVSRALTQLGLTVIVANPNALAVISRSVRKTDRNDAETLARLGRADLALLHPVTHRSEARQAALELLKARDAVVRSRTLQINHVRGAVKSFGTRIPACDSDSFARGAAQHIPATLGPALNPVLTSIQLLTQTIRAYDREVNRLCAKVYPETKSLVEIEGVGCLTALAFVLVLGDARRFKKSRQVGSYIGLCSKVSQSGEHDPQMRITKAGNAFLRKLLVQAAHYITGPFGGDATLRRIGQKLMASGGPRGKKRAVIAVARRLAVTMHHLWKTGEVYDPMRSAPDLVGAPTPG